jgi:hypothetical protein
MAVQQQQALHGYQTALGFGAPSSYGYGAPGYHVTLPPPQQ